MDTASPRLHEIARESTPSAPAIRKKNEQDEQRGRMAEASDRRDIDSGWMKENRAGIRGEKVRKQGSGAAAGQGTTGPKLWASSSSSSCSSKNEQRERRGRRGFRPGGKSNIARRGQGQARSAAGELEALPHGLLRYCSCTSAFANRGLRLARNMGSTFPGFPPFLVKGELDKETQAEEQQRGNRGGEATSTAKDKGKDKLLQEAKTHHSIHVPFAPFDASVSLLLLLLILECQLYEQTEEDRQGATHQR
ncbi:hypothetical protein TESG_04448 [Trichophyton tonsurans CBS 112818]|uniref:Uncharacterized protein n=1 Tax=Trichophyton tonsurans (strain CBS 112818) TaxID=647933 RepID=F2S0C7_TRIT1|nr:hypothetical protein TESG_04448 [Trichophyton tonsurans CBS 112818]